MSYILEALKKAQAERQLGNAPTIHAPQPVQVGTAAGGAAAQRKPLLVGLGAGALVVALGAAVIWRHGPGAEAQKPAQAVQPSTAPGAASVTLAVRAPDAPPPAPRAVESHAAEPRAAEPRAVPVAPAPVPASALAQAGGARVAGAVNQPAAAARPAQPDAIAQNAARQAPAPASASAPAPAPAPEDSLPLAQQLPEMIRNQIPRVAFGGYMYSPNPSDRLVLIDNVLRHEGEEVAAGLVFEKLMPKAVVMNFRGVRYRVAY